MNKYVVYCQENDGETETTQVICLGSELFLASFHQYKYYRMVVLGRYSPLSLSSIMPANPNGPWSSCADLYTLALLPLFNVDSCVIGELQTREVDVSVPERLLKNVVCGHKRMAITRRQHGSLRTSHTDQINITGICNKVIKGRREEMLETYLSTF